MSRTQHHKHTHELLRLTKPYQRKSRKQLLREFEEEYIKLNKIPLIKL